jgi:RNA polymerase sigma-70 factor (sigma-E family)
VTSWSDTDFDAFVGARMGALVRFAYALTGDLGHAEDLVQTALLRVYRHSRRTAPDNPEGYVRKAIVNANLSRFRRHRVPESLVGRPPDQAGTVDADSPGEQARALLRLLEGLSPRQRTVLALRYGADLSEAETAELLGVTVGTVKSLASRGLARLRADLDPTNLEGSRR